MNTFLYKPRVFLDMDGVIVDWSNEACRLLGIDPTNPKHREVLKYSEDGLNELVGKHKIKEAIAFAGADFWKSLKLLPWGKELHDRLQEVANVCFLTSYGHWPQAPAGKIAFLNRHFPETSVLFGRDKYWCAGLRTVLIDDKFDNVNAFREAGGFAIEWPNQYRIEDGDIDLARLIDEIIETVKKT